jgi:hypothetical protein
VATVIGEFGEFNRTRFPMSGIHNLI